MSEVENKLIFKYNIPKGEYENISVTQFIMDTQGINNREFTLFKLLKGDVYKYGVFYYSLSKKEISNLTKNQGDPQ